MSNPKIVSYDLCNSGKNYNGLYEYLESFFVWARLTESTWFISSDKTCTTIRDEIKNIVDSDDRIFVAELTGVSAWRNITCDYEYLRKYL